MFVLTAILQTLSGGYLKAPVYHVFGYYQIRTDTSLTKFLSLSNNSFPDAKDV